MPMKNHVNIALLVLFFLLSAVEFFLVLVWLEVITLEPGVAKSLMATLSLGFSAVPSFCLQLLLCRTVKGKWLRYLPLELVALIVAACGLAFLASSGWDGLGWLICLILCIGPTVGCLLAILLHALVRHFTKEKSA